MLTPTLQRRVVEKVITERHATQHIIIKRALANIYIERKKRVKPSLVELEEVALDAKRRFHKA